MIPLFFLAVATVHGTVTDAQKHAVEGAKVSLECGGLVLKAETDAAGRFQFAAASGSTCTARAEKKSVGQAVSAPFEPATSKQIDLTLQALDFNDEPQFVIAGVTDAGAHGGHGSDTVLRSSEALADATASLTQDETRRDPLNAERAYERAAQTDPSEPNLFDWGSELLLHRAAEPAIQVFSKGVRMHPESVRMLLGLAAALYTNGAYAQAAQVFFEACDKNPADPRPYLFLAKVQTVAITDLPGYAERMERFEKLQPSNAWAQYYYAVSLWKDRRNPEQVQSLLHKAVKLDPTMGAAHLQLGIVHFDQNDFTAARADFQKAIEIAPKLEEAHYRLGQVYRRLGETDAARKELAIYEQLSKESAREEESRRSEMGQFVYELRKR
jgi:tetratricopeptide (TPR) repeat protein